MDDSKAELLVRRICEKTSKKELEWERTTDSGVFQTTVAGFVVTLADRSRRDYSLFELALFNDEGELIEKYTDESFNESSRNMCEIMGSAYAAARRQVMGIDAAIDEILGELE